MNISVAVGAPSALPAPDLSGLDGKTLTVNDTLTLTYAYVATGFNWQVDSRSLAAASALAGTANAGVAANGPTRTSAPTLGLSVLHLTPGLYTVQVQAVNGSQTSAWSTAALTLVSADLSAIQIFPNPWRKDKHGGRPITFGNLPADSQVKIFTLSGRLIKDLGAANGAMTWDLTNDGGDKVASGIYVYLVTDGRGGKARGKFAVIK